MARRKRNDAEAPGQESFLDVVANLVGILIILVMIVGARAKGAFLAIESTLATTAEAADQPAEVTTAADMERSVLEVEDKIRRQEIEVAYRRDERDQTLALIKTLETALAARQSELDESQRADLTIRRDLRLSQEQLGQLQRAQQAVANSESATEVIQHQPTPIAHTVFGPEIHFRLLKGRVTYVPFNELVDLMRRDASGKAWKLKDAPKVTETLGPIEGFRVEYVLRRTVRTVQTSAGQSLEERVELDYCRMAPVSEELGEPLNAALQRGSMFHAILNEQDARKTTATIWVYPDSFNDFRKVKEELIRRGFQCAMRPLPEGELIGGSPRGSRSASE